MAHIDEGSIHTYLDGELDPVEAAQLEAHVADCPTCAANLAEARTLIDRTRSILADAAPYVEVPERLPAPSQQRRRRPAIPLAWAASVVLAITAGWLGRGIIARGNPDAPTLDALSADLQAPAEELVLRDSETVAVDQRLDTPSASEPPTSSEPVRGRLGTEDTQPQDIALRLADAAQEQEDEAREIQPTVQAERRVVEATPDVRAGRRAGEAAAAAPLASTAGAGANDAVMVDTIPGYEVIGLGSNDEFSLIVTQRSVQGDTVVVTYLRDGAGEADQDRSQFRQEKSRDRVPDPALARGIVRGVTVELTGTLSADSLRALLRLLEQR